jgi:hypothetical protein
MPIGNGNGPKNHGIEYGNFGKKKPQDKHIVSGDNGHRNRLRKIKPKARPV